MRGLAQGRHMSVLNLVAWHGRHDEAGFSEQMDAIDDLAAADRPTLVLGDVNRRACVAQASGATVLGNGDKRWRDRVDFHCECCAVPSGDDPVNLRLVPILDEREAAATRKALVEGSLKWSVLDRAVDMGDEMNTWRFEEIVWAEVPGSGLATISDHAAVCYERPLVQERFTVDGRPVLPRMKEWSTWHHKIFEELTKDVAQRAADECGGDAPRTLEFIDRELLDAAEAVEQQRLSKSLRHEGAIRVTGGSRVCGSGGWTLFRMCGCARTGRITWAGYSVHTST